MRSTRRDGDRRRFARSAAIGGALGAVVFFWMATAGTFDPFRWHMLADFYDAQAQSLLRGELAIDPEVLGIEGFRGRNGGTYMYQGPVPALLRLPVVALLGDRMDGRLTIPSMLAALAVMVVFATRLHWQVRSILRGDDSVSRFEGRTVALLTFVLAAGSPFLFEASRTWVYHEALVWGSALAVAALDQLLRFSVRPSAASLAACALLTSTALLSRVSVGLAPLAGLALVAGLAVASRLGFLRVPRGRRSDLPFWAPAAAAALPLCLYAAVNLAKFERPFSTHFEDQRFSQFDTTRQAMLAANEGSFFGLQFVPTTLQHYLRPDRIRFDGLFPFVDFPPFPGPLVGDAQFDLVDRTAALPCVAPLLLPLALVGVGHLLRPRAWRDPSLDSLRVLLAAAAAGGATVLGFGYIAHRYVCDFFPFLVVGGAIGVQVLLHGLLRIENLPGLALRAALVALAAASVWINIGLALLFQRLWSSNVEPRVAADFLELRADVAEALRGELPRERFVLERIGLDDDLPSGTGRPGALLMAGDCDALYVSDGMATSTLKNTAWNGVERTEAAGGHRFRVAIEPRPQGARVPIFTAGTSSEPGGLLLEYLGGDRVRFVYRASRGFGRVDRAVQVRFDRDYDLELFADWRVNRLSVRLEDRTVLESFFQERGGLIVGRNDVFADVEPRFAGRLERRDVASALCTRLARAGGR
jgi:hypothetical protein